jgi:hypothetical protein
MTHSYKGVRIRGTYVSLKHGWDDDDYYIKGSGFITYELEFDVFFRTSYTNVGGDNLFVIRFKFSGGGNMKITVIYTDRTTTDYYESAQSTYLTKAYAIDDNKIVTRIRFYNFEWWWCGHVWLDLVNVIY